MPDTLNKQTLINLLIDSPLREPIKINLIDIVNNTGDADLSKTYSTIVKELEIFQKATERRMKLANETIAKLQPQADRPMADGGSPPSPSPLSPADLPLPPAPPMTTPPVPPTPMMPPVTPTEGLSVPPLDLPPLPQVPPPGAPVTPPPTVPTPAAAPTSSDTTSALPPLEQPKASDADEAALAEIQKELDSLKSSAAADAQTPAPSTTPAAAPQA